MSIDEMDLGLIEEFILESVEMLDDVEPLVISAKNIDSNLANSLFRPVHNIKGTAGCFGFDNISNVSHSAENVLSLIRNSENLIIEADILIGFFDYLRKVLAAVMEKHTDKGFESEAEIFISDLNNLIDQLKKGNGAESRPQIKNAALESLKELIDEKELGQSILQELDENQLENSTPEIKNNPLLDEETIKIFYLEAKELLEEIENNLMSFLNDLDNKNILQEIYRAVHTLKGNFGLFNLSPIEVFAHKIENLIDEMINGKIAIDKNITEDLIIITDTLKEGVNFSLKDQLPSWNNSTSLKLIENYLQPEVINFTPKITDLKINDIKNKLKEAPINPSNDGSGNPSLESSSAKKDIRIDTIKLDYLNDIVGELLIAKTMIHKDIDFSTTNGEKLKKSFHFFSKVLGELQDTSMAMRMIPVASMFKKMVRIVHDISKKTKKKVKIEFFGESTEVDKSLIDVINNPLLHMLRNSVDHGIESEEERLEKGKPKHGTIKVGAIHESGEVWIIVEDDGKGLNKDAIIDKALKNEIISEDQVETMSDQDIFKLIFTAGFSTAEKVSDISGRGVGMDVVMQNIQKMKGRVSIESKQDIGTTFTIKIPLTLAIIDGMLINCGGIKYTIPIDSIQETIKVKNIEVDRIVQEQELIKIRNKMIPIVKLNQIHKIRNSVDNIEEGILMIIESRGTTIALLVDSLLGQHQTIIKSLPNYFEKINLNYIKGLSGCSIQGDGEVGLILDVSTLIEKVQMNEKTINLQQ